MKELDQNIINMCKIITDINFLEEKPVFGDLLAVTGLENLKFPVKNSKFFNLVNLEIEQVNDFFTIFNKTDYGVKNILWIIPIIKKTEVMHNSGPFDGLRFTYDVLGNNEENRYIYFKCIESFLNLFRVNIYYRGNKQENLDKIKADIEKIIRILLEEDIKPGSDKALELDY